MPLNDFNLGSWISAYKDNQLNVTIRHSSPTLYSKRTHQKWLLLRTIHRNTDESRAITPQPKTTITSSLAINGAEQLPQLGAGLTKNRRADTDLFCDAGVLVHTIWTTPTSWNITLFQLWLDWWLKGFPSENSGKLQSVTWKSYFFFFQIAFNLNN